MVASHYGLDLGDLAQSRRGDVRWAVAAGIARRYTPATRRELAEGLGLGHPDSVGNLLRRFDQQTCSSAAVQADVAAIETALQKTENRV